MLANALFLGISQTRPHGVGSMQDRIDVCPRGRPSISCLAAGTRRAPALATASPARSAPPHPKRARRPEKPKSGRFVLEQPKPPPAPNALFLGTSNPPWFGSMQDRIEWSAPRGRPSISCLAAGTRRAPDRSRRPRQRGPPHRTPRASPPPETPESGRFMPRTTENPPRRVANAPFLGISKAGPMVLVRCKVQLKGLPRGADPPLILPLTRPLARLRIPLWHPDVVIPPGAH